MCKILQVNFTTDVPSLRLEVKDPTSAPTSGYSKSESLLQPALHPLPNCQVASFIRFGGLYISTIPAHSFNFLKHQPSNSSHSSNPIKQTININSATRTPCLSPNQFLSASSPFPTKQSTSLDPLISSPPAHPTSSPVVKPPTYLPTMV